MDFLKEIIGEELFKQVEAKVSAYNADPEHKDNQVKIAAFSVVPCEDAELKRIQITLNIKEWSVNNE